MANAPTNKATFVRDQLREEILKCRLLPGEKLKINELCATFSVTLGAVREALTGLEGEGLVDLVDKKGFQVSAISRDELAELTQARIEIEAACMKLAIGSGGEAWEADIEETLRVLLSERRTAEDSRKMDEDWSNAHSDFHLALVSACRNTFLLNVREKLYLQSERYRRLSIPGETSDRDVDKEHRELANACLARDPDLARDLIDVHLRNTARLILKQATNPYLGEKAG